METITSEPQQNRPQRDGMFVSRRGLFLLVLALLTAVSALIGMWTALPGSSNDRGVTPAVEQVVKQDCTKPGTKVGELCSSVKVEHGVTVTRTYVTLKYDTPANTFYNYLQGTTVQLNYGNTATIDDLCRAGAVATTNSDHPYDYEYATTKKEYCNPAQKAKDAGNFKKCASILDGLAYAAPAAFTWSNVDDACAVPAQPKAKEALVDTSQFLNDTQFYANPSATPTH